MRVSLRSILLVTFLWFLSIGIISAQSVSSFQVQVACSGSVNGTWDYTAKENGSCTCPMSIPLPSFDRGSQFDVCQNGNNISGNILGFTKLKGTVSGQQVNFTMTTKFTDNSQGIKIAETLTDTHKGTLQGDTVSGTVSSNWKFNVSGQGVDISCGCNLNGTFKVDLSGGGGPGPGDDEDDPSTEDVTAESGLIQIVETLGVQWTDVNKDNKLDLFMVGENLSALFKNNGNGTFSEVASGLLNIALVGAAWADFDNDGDFDVMVFNTAGQIGFLKNTNGAFTEASKHSSTGAGRTLGGIWLDYNNDGKIDAYIIKDGAPNQLFKNIGSGKFEEVSAAANVNVSGPGRSAVAADFNGDGFADLYIVNFRANNKLLINNGNGTFRAATGASFVGASVQAIVGDYNNDQRFDILVVNNGGPSTVFKNTGNDVSGNPQFAKVNVGISGARNGDAAAFADFNNDGFLDLVLVRSPGGNILFRNKRDGTFSAVGTVDLNNPRNPTSLTTGDFNNDGLVDIMIGDGDSTQTNGDTLYKNSSNKNHWLEIALQGTRSNRSAITAVVVIRNGSTFQARMVSGGNGQNQDSFILHFGLGANTKVDEMQIFWPGGVAQRCLNVKPDRIVRVTEGSPSNLGCQPQ